MIRISGGIFQAANAVPIVGLRQGPPRLAQAPRAPSESPIIALAREKRDEAATHLRSVEDNLTALEQSIGPEDALQALEEGRQSVERTQHELDAALKTGTLE